MPRLLKKFSDWHHRIGSLRFLKRAAFSCVGMIALLKYFLVLLFTLPIFAFASEAINPLEEILNFDGESSNQLCTRLPGLMVEMGSDQPLDNWTFCFEINQSDHGKISRLGIPQAHHVLNTEHLLVAGETVCDGGSISDGIRVVALDHTFSKEIELYLEVSHLCGRGGCEYRLSYFSHTNYECSVMK